MGVSVTVSLFEETTSRNALFGSVITRTIEIPQCTSILKVNYCLKVHTVHLKKFSSISWHDRSTKKENHFKMLTKTRKTPKAEMCSWNREKDKGLLIPAWLVSTIGYYQLGVMVSKMPILVSPLARYVGFWVRHKFGGARLSTRKAAIFRLLFSQKSLRQVFRAFVCR